MKVDLLVVVVRYGSPLVSARGRSPRRRGFTLIELLVVMAIIAIPAAAVIPVSNMIMGQVRKLQATHAASDLRKSITTWGGG